jgi:glycosyltransferase involved in cell wall biosynthesis
LIHASKKGVSIVICCHNSAEKITQTLRNLQQQTQTETIPWEVVLVDNASSDGTANTAQEVWRESPVTLLRIVDEERLGLINARLKGLKEAGYEYISFVDDDNWVASDWIARVYEIMKLNPAVGACGGLNSAEFEGETPVWFDKFSRSYAVGEQGSAAGDVTEDIGVLFGAGLTIRKSAWNALSRAGFTFNLVGRKGNSLMCGEDYEICLALRLAGWKLWYEPSLRLKHFMPKSRMEWMYLRRMLRGAGESDAGLLPYYYCLNKDFKFRRPLWVRPVSRALRNLLPHIDKLVLMKFKKFEGDAEILNIERSVGLISRMFRRNSDFDRMVQKVMDADWVKN